MRFVAQESQAGDELNFAKTRMSPNDRIVNPNSGLNGYWLVAMVSDYLIK